VIRQISPPSFADASSEARPITPGRKNFSVTCRLDLCRPGSVRKPPWENCTTANQSPSSVRLMLVRVW